MDKFVDAQSDKNAKPITGEDSLSKIGQKWQLVFSDEFNDLITAEIF